MAAVFLFLREFWFMFRYSLMKKVVLNSLLGVILCCGACFFSASTFAMSIAGEWRTVSDDNGESTSVIKIVKQKDTRNEQIVSKILNSYIFLVKLC